MKEIPAELGTLQKLEHISLRRNHLEKVFGELTTLPCLRTINLRHNKLKSSGIPPQMFELDDLTTLDLSWNNLRELPQGLDKARSLLVLNLSNNRYIYLIKNNDLVLAVILAPSAFFEDTRFFIRTCEILETIV